MTGREMEQSEVKALAFDVACGFFDDGQLCDRYDLEEYQLASIRDQRPFRKAVDEVRFLLQDDGSNFVIEAKRKSVDALNAMHQIVEDVNTSDPARIKAAQQIFALAKLNHAPKVVDAGTAIGQLVIHTNLALNANPQGVYTIEATAEKAEKVEPKLIESRSEDYLLVAGSDLL